MYKKIWLVFCLALFAQEASAFCGFYASSGGAKVFNNATQVVLMRDGTKVVLSMQNNYQGPAEDFALVIPVPVILKKEDVKTLEPALFDRLDQLDAPRLVEYWEQDPCYLPVVDTSNMTQGGSFSADLAADVPTGRSYGVTIEAQFNVGEYDIVILSAKESLGLYRWLKDSKYNIPKGAEAVLKPYTEAGLKFFVAKVDPKKIKFNGKQAMLSPLRFAYDSETFFLPVRLGLLNAADYQDLIVHILAKDRYEAANYDNVTIPTNLDVVEGVKEEFGPFYASLFDAVVKKNPSAVVTEYAWAAQSCDPCPVDPVSASELLSFGAGLLPMIETVRYQHGEEQPTGTKWVIKNGTPAKEPPPTANIDTYALSSYFTLTRLHARYNKDSLGDDLVFRVASPIVGGREEYQKKQDTDAKQTFVNNFQARYIIRHEWKGAITCQNPVRGIWGGPPGGGSGISSAQNLAFVKRGSPLDSYLVSPSDELKSYFAKSSIEPGRPLPKAPSAESVGGCSVNPTSGGVWLLALCSLVLVRRRAKK